MGRFQPKGRSEMSAAPVEIIGDPRASACSLAGIDDAHDLQRRGHGGGQTLPQAPRGRETAGEGCRKAVVAARIRALFFFPSVAASVIGGAGSAQMTEKPGLPEGRRPRSGRGDTRRRK